MGDVKSSDYKTIHEMEGWAHITGNQQYYLLVAMKMDRENYLRYTDDEGIMHVQLVWEENPEFIEVVW